MDMRGGVTRRDKRRRTTREDRATQPLGCWKAEFRNKTTKQTIVIEIKTTNKNFGGHANAGAAAIVLEIRIVNKTKQQIYLKCLK